MAGIAFAVTGDVFQTAVIAFSSAVITGLFLIVNTLIQHSLTQRDFENRMQPKQDEIIQKIDELKE